MKLAFSPRHELRLALLAAMEACWMYAILAFLAAGMSLRALSPLTLFGAYWLALVVGRVLPRSKKRWLILQLLAIGIAFITILAVVRVEFFARLAVTDFAWLPRILRSLFTFADGFAAEHLASLAVLFVFVRGLGFAQRPLTLWFVGFQFRLGIVFFFLLLLVAGLLGPSSITQGRPFDISVWIFVYFFLSLLAIALARIDETESIARLGPRWAITLLTAVAAVIFLGLGVLQFFTVDVAEALLLLLMPLWLLVATILVLLAIPVGVIVGWLIDLLQPLFKGIGSIFDALQKLIPPDTGEKVQQVIQPEPILAVLLPLLKTLFVLTILLGIGYVVARALNRRMKALEEETYLRESIGLDDDVAWAQRAALAKKAKPRRRAGHIAAETIRRIYAALVARAGEAGLPRHIAETPYEFLPRLERAWSAHAPEVRAITEAYVAVHYGEYDATVEEVRRVQVAWERVKRKA